MKKSMNFRLSIGILTEAEEFAKKQGIPLTLLVEEGMRMYIHPPKQEAKPLQSNENQYLTKYEPKDNRPIDIIKSRFGAQKVAINVYKKRPTGYIFNIEGNMMYIPNGRIPFTYKEKFYNFTGFEGKCTDCIYTPKITS